MEFKEVTIIDQDGTKFLADLNGRPLRCPWVAPIVMPGKLAGTVDFQPVLCGTSCVLCRVGVDIAELGCVSAPDPLQIRIVDIKPVKAEGMKLVN